MNRRKDLAPALTGSGRQYWRSLEELAATDDFRDLMLREFPEQAACWPEPLSRRRFLTLMGASLALAGLSGCSVRPAPTRQAVPQVRPPEEVVPGRPLFYATAMTLGGAGVGLLVESHLGRPTKIEGNPDHPASLGATSPLHQASILTLYDPDRSQTVTHLGRPRTWDDFEAVLRTELEAVRHRRGAGLYILSESVVSPTLARQRQELLAALPDAKWHQYEPLARDAAYRGAVLAFGKDVNAVYDFRAADVVLSLDADFLTVGPACVRYTADFMARRRIHGSAAEAAQTRMNRLYAVEPTVTSAGAKADHRLALPAGEIEAFARALAARLGVVSGAAETGHRRWIDALAADLERHRGRCLVLTGDGQPPSVHLLVHALNRRLGNVGQTVTYTEPIAAPSVDQAAALGELTADIERGAVSTLLMLGGNPAYDAPAELSFTERLQRVPFRAHLSLYQDETSRLCPWHLPEAHYLECWSDTRAYDGTATIMQPLIDPLYQGRSCHEVLSLLLAPVRMPGHEIVRQTWRHHWEERGRSGDFETFWESAVHDGVVPGTKLAAQTPDMQAGWERHLGAAPPTEPGWELVFQSDPAIFDGRFANNGWLQELPRPLTTLTWDNAFLMSPATARALDVGLGSYAHGGEHGGYHPDVLELRLGERSIRAPIWIVPGHAERSISIALGYGRERAGRVGSGVGVNVYPLRTAAHPWFLRGVEVRKTGERALLACTQAHHLMENRALVRSATLSEYQRDPGFAARPDEERLRDQAPRARLPLSMYEPHPNDGPKWGMVIDLALCTGCKACVVACQAENNIPVVGKEQVAAGREMHWLRVDRYVSGSADAPSEFHFQPVPCMHCEQAPCEYVCPTEATVHSGDGLNDMVYQRCVGTRFCSNNCPYKVRRFNFFQYADFHTPSLRLQYNPDVTVRSRGVMEKCTYCVQRIRHAVSAADAEGRTVRDGEVLTACQAACPAQAIVFGDLSADGSAVKQWRASPRNYELLGELNTHPRTTYLAALRNPNPELEGA
jgi:molybdopterin-containing oxidoreductase family iron-sulfur binding subunit